MIKVLKPGLQTTVQDKGRVGYYETGMPPSGAVDQFSYAVANLLTGNQKGAATLEITYMGPHLEFQEPATIALTGGNIPPKINGEPVSMWETLTVNAGDQLSFDFVKEGARSYLAVTGGIQVPEVMGSKSTYTLCGIGGFDGRALQKDDSLLIGNEDEYKIEKGATVPEKYIPVFSKKHEIRVIIGLCDYRLTEDSKKQFFDLEWTVTPEANRVGYRLKGERLNFVPREQPFGAGSNPSNVVDLGYPIGSIQIPDGVEPIALLNDAVTGGGYATIATIISTDLNRIAQAKTNEKIQFISVSLEEALQARQDTKQQLEEIERLIKSK